MTSRSWGRSGRSWSDAVARVKADRLTRPAIREDALPGTSIASKGLRVSAWRGQSGRRYVVIVHPIEQALDFAGESGPVIIGVRREAGGIARIVGVGHRGSVSEGAALAKADGATEIHLHNLADSDAEREAIVEDLVGDDAI